MIVFINSQLLAERIFLKSGAVIDGKILQQSRTEIQLRTLNGQVLMIQKSNIQKIDYTFDEKKETEHQIEEKQRKAIEAQKIEKENKEKLERAKEERAKEERAKKPIHDFKNQQDRLSNQRRWWVEPLFSIGNGKFQSGVSSFYWDSFQGDYLAAAIDPIIENRTFTFQPETRWNYYDKANSNIALKAGMNQFAIELDNRSYTSKVNFYNASHTSMPGFGAMQELDEIRIDDFNENHTSFRVGYQILNNDNLLATVFLGSRNLNTVANYNLTSTWSLEVFGVTNVYYNFSPKSELSLKGNGPELTFELEKKIESLILRTQFTLFRMNVNAYSVDKVMVIEAATQFPQLNWSEIENSYQYKGGALTLFLGYQFNNGNIVFLEWYNLKADSYLNRVNHALVFTASPSSIQPQDPNFGLSSMLLLPEFVRKQGNALLIETFSVGITRRFVFTDN